jgi:mono/diheme cytochrome c family protein
MKSVNSLLRAAAALLFATVLLTAPASSQSSTPAEELPDGEGKKILQAQCASCHELTEVTKFRGYYNRAQWRDIVITMVEYGADLKKTEIETLADYLAQHLGKP